MAFLENSAAPAKGPNVNDRFAKYSIGKKTKSKDTKDSSHTSSSSDVSTSSPTKPPSSPKDKPSPVQGRFVNAMVNQYLRKSRESLNSPSSVVSSGLGSSLGNSPTSPKSPTFIKTADGKEQPKTAADFKTALASYKSSLKSSKVDGEHQKRNQLLTDIKAKEMCDRTSLVMALDQKVDQQRRQSLENPVLGDQGMGSLLDSLKNNLQTVPSKSNHSLADSRSALNSSSEWD